MQPNTSRNPGPTRFAEFDAAHRLLRATPGFLDDGTGGVASFVKGLASVDGDAVTAPGVVDAVLARWRTPGANLRARTLDGDALLLCSHETAADGYCLLVADASQPEEEHRLESSESRWLLADALRALEEAFALFDEDGRLIVWNERYREINSAIAEFIESGVHWETLLREMARRRLVPHAEGREAAWVAEMLRAGENFENFEVNRTDGMCLSVTVHPTTLGGFIVSEVDVTSRKLAEQTARESEQLLSKTLEASPANLCMSRIGSGEVIYRSPACAELFGRETSARDQFANGVEWADFLTDLLASGRVRDFAATARNADDQEFPALFSAQIVDYRGEDVVVSSVTDMTEQARARRELADANTRLNDAIESLDEGFALYDADEKLVLWNRRYAELNAHVSDRLRKGVAYGELLDAAIASGKLGQRDIERTLQSGDPEINRAPRRYEFEHNDGKWFSVSRNPTSENGFVITRLDITERKRAEAAEREADDLLRRVLDACPVNLLMCRSDDGRVIYHSANTVERFGRREWVSDYWVDVGPGLDMARDIQAQGGRDLRLFDIKGADDTPVRVELSSRLIDYRGEPMIVSHAYDMTDRIAMEEELNRQRDMLHQSEKLSALGELLAGVAHELNNPLSVVVGHALMLQEEISDPALLGRTDKISAAAERCSRIVKTFLAMARQRPAKLERISINTVIETAMDVAGYGLRGTGAHVSLDLARDLPPVMGDSDQLAQVFANLIVNAEHVLVALGTEGAFSIHTHLSGDGRVMIDVEDNGPGIPEQIRGRIFEPFFTTKAIGEGTGIGLAFCHRIIDTHGGRISVMNRAQGGARFSIRLDACGPHEAVGPSGAPEPAAGHRNGVALVIDDDEDIAALIAQILTGDGYKVVVAHSAEDALDHLPGAFDLILSDLNMPGISGQELLEMIRAQWPSLVEKIGFITGDTASAGVDGFLRMAGRPYLEKPVAPAELRRMAAEMMA
ncbi:MAG: PAS-domain containing protein [Pseudomonadota bacterium]